MDSETFLTNLNSLHTSLKFTSEKEVNQSLPFLDVLVTKSTNNFTTYVYRKATFTGEYIRWNSFGPKTRKTNLIATLTHRALKICSKSSLQQELDTIKSLFLKNGYPESVINARISKKILQFQKHPIEGPQRCPVYLKLPWIGETSVIFEKKIKSSILNCFSTVQPRVIFTTRRILPAIHKDVLPASQLSMVVYQYVCRCECRYVGRTSQRLQDRIRQHVPKTIRNKTNQERIQPTRKSKINSFTPNCDSAIGTHLLKHPNCALHYNDNQFSILSKARSEFHLAVLESIHITSSKPALCRQKEFVYRLKLST